MNKIKEIIYRNGEKIGLKKGNIVPFLIAVVLTLAFFLDSTYFDNYLTLMMWIAIGTALSVIILWIAIKAGFTVLKNLFILSAEISLLIFLAQSYCEQVGTTSKSDDALKSLIGLGIIYITYEFFKALFKAMKERLDSFPEKEWSKEKVLVVFLFLIFTATFVYAIYQVTNPIISNLCIYRR